MMYTIFVLDNTDTWTSLGTAQSAAEAFEFQTWARLYAQRPIRTRRVQ